jgi:hypothetical protein
MEVYLLSLPRFFMACTKTSFVNFTSAEEHVIITLKQTARLVPQFWHFSRHGSRYEIHVPTRGWTAPTARSERREHGSSLQSVPRNRGGAAENDCCAQRKVRPLTFRIGKWFLLVCFSFYKKERCQEHALFQYHLVYSWGTSCCTFRCLSKTAISDCQLRHVYLSVRPSFLPSFLPHETTLLPRDGYSWNLVFVHFLKICRENTKSINFRHRSFTFNSYKSPTLCNSFSVYYPDVCLQLNMNM